MLLVVYFYFYFENSEKLPFPFHPLATLQLARGSDLLDVNYNAFENEFAPLLLYCYHTLNLSPP